MTLLATEPYQEPDVIGEDPALQATLFSRITRPFSALRGVRALGTWTGVLVIAVGFLLLAIAWGKVAGQTQVARQLPYVVSAGFTGLGLVTVGLALSSISAKRADAAERSRQLRELRDLLSGLSREHGR